ncbi:MAG: Maf family protein [Deltaproteobacteria bacterium]|nr:Maf family protein [Deltaproteobacteria bacterium]
MEAPLFRNLRPLILASGSLRRRELLGSAGLAFRVLPSPAKEKKPLPGENPAEYARRTARAKAEAVLDGLGAEEAESAVLAGDTIVVLEGKILGKPASHAQALEMLRSLAGKTHTVVTACCLLFREKGESRRLEFHRESRVSMWDAPPALLLAYSAGDEPMDKAGAYALQGGGGVLIRSVEGSCSNVLGLPLSEVMECLLECGIIAHASPPRS